MRMSVPCVHVVGRKNHGKTTLASELVESLGARGLRVGAIKHTPHPHALDAEGSDSARLGGAGAAPWAFLSGAGSALFLPAGRALDPERALDLVFGECDLVVVEGGLEWNAPKLEVWRAERGGLPIAYEEDGRHRNIRALVTDDPLPPGRPPWLETLRRADGQALVGEVLRLAKEAK